MAWTQLSAFVRQFTHDIRNDLNALSLEAALLKEIVTDPEAVTSATRIQSQLREIAGRLKSISTRFALPPVQIRPVNLTELSRLLGAALEGTNVAWTPCDSDAEIETDPVLLSRAFNELAQNASSYAPAESKEPPTASLTQETDGRVLLTIREPKATLQPWPDTAFTSPKSRRYGAGLALSTAILQALEATLERRQHAGHLETRISLPATS